MSLAFSFMLNGATHAVTVAARKPRLRLAVDDRVYDVSEVAGQPGEGVELYVDGRRYRVWRTWEGDRIHLRIGTRSYSVDYEDAIAAAQHQVDGGNVLRADMPGVVVSVTCAAGSAVSAGDTLMVIESMKMQVNIVAPRDAVVESVPLTANQSFDKGAELLVLKAQD